ncbi:hypothetical protein FB451DRAFT_1175970 [Mycena latifolia]|nr:hypothetical protein FB451DRAFT_1175970 [Mycena latifolia]
MDGVNGTRMKSMNRTLAYLGWIECTTALAGLSNSYGLAGMEWSGMERMQMDVNRSNVTSIDVRGIRIPVSKLNATKIPTSRPGPAARRSDVFLYEIIKRRWMHLKIPRDPALGPENRDRRPSIVIVIGPPEQIHPGKERKS